MMPVGGGWLVQNLLGNLGIFLVCLRGWLVGWLGGWGCAL